MPRLIEDEFEWVERNNHKFVTTQNGTKLFATGGQLIHQVRGPNLRVDPPADPKALLKLRRRYHEIRLAAATHGFERLKQIVTTPGTTREGQRVTWKWNEADLGEPMPTETDFRTCLPCPKIALLKLRELVRFHKEAIAVIDFKIAELPEEVERRKQQELREEYDRQSREQDYRIKQELDSIILD